MLRKIEFSANLLIEARDYIELGPKKKELEVKEQKLHQDKRERRIQNKKAEDERLRIERDEKNMARIRKQEDFKLFRGKKPAVRSNKIKIKKEQEDKKEDDEEVIDMKRYLGTVIQ